MGDTVRLLGDHRETRRADPVAQFLADLHGGRPEAWRLKLYRTRDHAVEILDAFGRVGEVTRREVWFQPVRVAGEAMPVERLSDDLILEKVASDGLEDTYRDEWLCYRTPDATRRWRRALAQERADNLRVSHALALLDGAR